MALGLGLALPRVPALSTKAPTQTNPSVVAAPVLSHYDFLAPPAIAETTDTDEFSRSIPDRKRSFCTDRAIIPIWNALRDDRFFRDQLKFTFESQDCRDILEVYYKDLNRDGTVEILVRGKTADACGAVGNCLFWILKKQGKGYRILLTSSDYVDVAALGEEVRTTFTNGHSDILLRGHVSAGETSYSYYKYDGRRYREAKCLYQLAVSFKGSEPVWGFISCREYMRRLDAEIAAQNAK